MGLNRLTVSQVSRQERASGNGRAPEAFSQAGHVSVSPADCRAIRRAWSLGAGSSSALSTMKKLCEELVLLLPVLLEDGTQAGTTADMTQTKPCTCQHHGG